MSGQPLSEERLAELLVEAKDAHMRYEQETGEYDEDWPRWYARYILERVTAPAEAGSEPDSETGPVEY